MIEAAGAGPAAHVADRDELVVLVSELRRELALQTALLGELVALLAGARDELAPILSTVRNGPLSAFLRR